MSGGDTDDTDDPGQTLLYEPGGKWWVVAIGPVLIAAILILEITGGGAIHWEVFTFFGVILVGFSVLQVVAARKHVSVHLTETTLREGTQTIKISEIVKIFPANTGPEARDWESAPALGELHAVPRRRKGIGLRLQNGKLVQAWARDGERLRTELTEAHLAITMGLAPKGSSDTKGRS
ncbi:EbsA family protein [Gordonia shandongensis]|uniref:EbsA family protein n=1 Tax=Gordonia shandongensis TaxID=376351 RepID=UPI00042612B1|nr:EbsA family protein [Gordonia shandongensis]